MYAFHHLLLASCPVPLLLYWLHLQWVNRRSYLALAAALADARSLPPLAGKRISVIVNPSAGGGTATTVFHKIVNPLLAAASIQVDVIWTTSTRHVMKVAAGFDTRSVDCIMFISGDGTLHEFLNAYVQAKGGLTRLSDFKVTPICHVPVGTCNMLALALGLRTPVQCVQRIISMLRSETPPHNLDVYTVTRCDSPQKTLVDFAITCWGALADMDLELERMPRNLPAFVRALAKLLVPLKYIMLLRSRHASVVVETDNVDGKVDLSGDFLLTSVQNLPWIDPTALFVPGAKHDDGFVHVLLWRTGMSRLQALLAFLSVESGGHIGRPGVEVHKATRVEFTPSGGEIDICGTGEVGLPAPVGGKIVIEVLPAAICVM